MVDIRELENILMDLVEDELKAIEADHSLTNVKFNLHKFRILTLYTKWKRNILSEDDRNNYF